MAIFARKASSHKTCFYQMMILKNAILSGIRLISSNYVLVKFLCIIGISNSYSFQIHSQNQRQTTDLKMTRSSSEPGPIYIAKGTLVIGLLSDENKVSTEPKKIKKIREHLIKKRTMPLSKKTNTEKSDHQSIPKASQLISLPLTTDLFFSGNGANHSIGLVPTQQFQYYFLLPHHNALTYKVDHKKVGPLAYKSNYEESRTIGDFYTRPPPPISYSINRHN